MLFHTIKMRHPNLISDYLTKKIDRLAHVIAKYEAEMFHTYRIQEMGGDRIDLEGVFAENKKYKCLLTLTTVQIVRDVIDNVTFTSVGNVKNELFITETGKKYHSNDCPYCKGKTMAVATIKKIKMLELTPCKCIKDKEALAELADTYRTIFIDESIHKVKWNFYGVNGKTGSYRK